MKRMLAVPAVFLLLALLAVRCKGGGDVAGGTDRLLLSADPVQIGANAQSTLTVLGMNEKGESLPDGTTVTFSVDKTGRVSPSAVQLMDGAATSTYFSTLSAGEITITATSGSVQARTTITVADNIQRKVFVSADPATFPTGGGTSFISAVVTDNSGKPLEDVGVKFSTTGGTLQSGGSFIATNGNGLATDILNTSTNAVVTATTEDGFTGQASVTVDVGQIVCHMTVSNSNPAAGQVVLYYDTSDDPGGRIVRYHWDFGDSTAADGKNVQHTYGASGSYRVLHSVTDSQDKTYTCDPFPIEVTP